MAENEQGGMLRVVIVVGLVALIAIVVFAAVKTLLGKMKKTTDDTNTSVNNAHDDAASVASSYASY